MEEDKEGFEEIELKPQVCNLKQLAAFYRIHPKTMRKWLIPFAKYIGKKTGQFYNIIQCRRIFRKLGAPILIRKQKG